MSSISHSLFFFFFLIENPWACRERASCNGLVVGLACRGLLGLVLLFYLNLFFQILVQIFFWGFFFFFGLKVEQITDNFFFLFNLMVFLIFD